MEPHERNGVSHHSEKETDNNTVNMENNPDNHYSLLQNPQKHTFI